MHFIDLFILACRSRVKRVGHKPLPYLILAFLSLLILSNRFAFPDANAATLSFAGGNTSLETTSLVNVFIPFAFQSGPSWPDLTGVSPTPTSNPTQAAFPIWTPTSLSTHTGQPTLEPTTALTHGSPTIIPTSTSNFTPIPTSTLTATATSTTTPTPTQDPLVCQDPVRIMPLGDSITRGSGSTSTNGYRRALYQELLANARWVDLVGSYQDGSADFDRHHEGHSGWSADGGSRGSIADNVYSFLTTHPADIVLLHIGTNDIQEGHEDPAEVALILDEIWRRSMDTQVVLALIINQDTYNIEITQYNEEVRQLAQELIDAGHALFLVDMENALSYPDDMADIVHPNNSGYAKMAGVWFDALADILPVCPWP